MTYSVDLVTTTTPILYTFSSALGVVVAIALAVLTVLASLCTYISLMANYSALVAGNLL